MVAQGVGRGEIAVLSACRGVEVQELRAEAAACGVGVSSAEAERLVELLALVWASPLGLTGIRNWVDGRRKHLVDSLAWLPFAGLAAGETLFDVGSGAGFPGLPAAVMTPSVGVTLVEANRRRCGFLRETVAKLGLSNVTVLEVRAEELARADATRERVDCVVARAVAPMVRLVEYLLPLCKVGGRVLMLKGPRWAEEWAMASGVARRLGAGAMTCSEYALPEGTGMRTVVRLEKERSTPSRYWSRARVTGQR